MTKCELRSSVARSRCAAGAAADEGPLPPYLTRVGFERAKKHLDRLEIQCADLRDFAARWRGSDRIKWSLSDVSCWMSEREFHDLIRRLVRCGAPGSRLCARHFAARSEIPDDLRDRVRRLVELSARLDRDDSCVFYRFEVATSGPLGAVRARARPDPLA